MFEIPELGMRVSNTSFLCFAHPEHMFLLFSGDTFTDGSVKYTMTSMNVPEPVMSLAVQPVSKDSGGQVSSLCLYYFFVFSIK